MKRMFTALALLRQPDAAGSPVRPPHRFRVAIVDISGEKQAAGVVRCSTNPCAQVNDEKGNGVAGAG